MITKKIGKITLHLKESLTYGEEQEVQRVMLQDVKVSGSDVQIDAAKMLDARNATISFLLKKVEDGDKTIVGADNVIAWLNELDAATGNKVVAAVDAVSQKKS